MEIGRSELRKLDSDSFWWRVRNLDVVFRVYKRGKNKDSFVKKQYFFSNFCPDRCECPPSPQRGDVVSLTEQGFQALCRQL